MVYCVLCQRKPHQLRVSPGSSKLQTLCLLSPLQHRHVLPVALSSHSLNSPIQRDDPSLVLDCETQQIGIGHLAMADQPFLKRLHGFRQSDVHRPEAMTGTFHDGLEQLDGLNNTYWLLMELAIGNYPDETRLRQRAGGPRLAARLAPPPISPVMSYMPFVGRRNQNVDVQQGRAHHSSSSSLTRSIVSGSFGFGRSNIGNPSTYLIRVRELVAR